MASQPWYTNPALMGVLGALLGAIVTSGVTLFIWRRSRSVKRVDCAVHEPRSLLSISDGIASKLKVEYGGEVVSAAYLFRLEVANTGNQPIRNQPVVLQLAPGSVIIDYHYETEPVTGFGAVLERGGNTTDSLSLETELMNPGDRIDIEVLTINNRSPTIHVGLKNEGVETRIFGEKAIDSVLGGFAKSSSLTMLAAFGMLPFIGGFSRSVTTLIIARKLDRLGDVERRKSRVEDAYHR